MSTVSVIVMEPGSEWPRELDGSHDVVAVRCDDDGGLLDRTRQRLDALHRSGQRVGIAALACSEAADAQSVARRAAVAHELLTAVAPLGFGRLVLSCAAGASSHLQRELLSLADALSQRLRRTSATVTVKFGGGAARTRSVPAALRKTAPSRTASRPRLTLTPGGPGGAWQIA